MRTGREVIRQAAYGFVTEEELRLIAADPVTAGVMCLVRFWDGRMVLPARLVAGLVAEEERYHRYVRDVSVLGALP